MNKESVKTPETTTLDLEIKNESLHSFPQLIKNDSVLDFPRPFKIVLFAGENHPYNRYERMHYFEGKNNYFSRKLFWRRENKKIFAEK